MLARLSDLDLRLLRVFLAVIRSGGITQAQHLLNVSQPTISTQLSTLETRLGFRLCERGRSGFRLTDKGSEFARMAADLITRIEEFERQARNMDKQLVGTLDIGLIGHTPINHSVRLAEAIAKFRQRDQAVRFNVSVLSPSAIEESLLSDKIQIAIGYFWHRVQALDYTSLFIERQIAYCGFHHPLFPTAGNLSPKDLQECNWAWRSYAVPQAMPSIAPQRITAVADNMEAMAVLIMSGHLGYLPQHFAEPYIARGLMAALNPKEYRYDVTFHVVSKKHREINEITRTFLSDLRSAYLDESQSTRQATMAR